MRPNRTPQPASRGPVHPVVQPRGWAKPPTVQTPPTTAPHGTPDAKPAEVPRPAQPQQLLTKRDKLGFQRPLGPLDRTGNADRAAADVQALLTTLKKEQSARKKQLEDTLAKKLGEATTEDQRGRLILNHGVALTKLGVDAALLKRDARFTQMVKKYGLTLDADTISLEGTDIFHLRTGAAAFDREPIVKAGGAITRDVYRKFGKAEGKNNEYIKDDEGVFTRRYAFVEKSKYQLRELLNRGVITGRYSSDPSSQTPRAYNTFDPKLRDRVKGLPADSTTFANSYQLAYVHQELGSWQEQRGVSATSVEKHAIFSNQGETFKTGDGVRFELDLARVPNGAAGTPQVINHYAAEAQTKMDGSNLGITGTHPRDFVHYQKSTIKNRELFVKDLKPEYLSRLTLHAGGDTTLDAPAEGFNVATLKQAVGNSGGYVDYSAGFKDWVGRRPSAQPDNPLYVEGLRDATKYTNGFELGRKARAEAAGTRPKPDEALAKKVGYIKATDDEYKKQEALKNERWKQGFWDAYWGRQPRQA